MTLEIINYSHERAKLKGRLALPKNSSGERPAVVIFHEAWGLGEHVQTRALRLAELGYVAFAADLFGEGATSESPDEALARIAALSATPDMLRGRAQAAVEQLVARDEVDADRIAAIGFCFGGAVALELARAGAKLKAVVGFHATLVPFGEAAVAPLGPRILICHGHLDPLIPEAQISAFQAEMQTAQADWAIYRFGRAQHGFTNPASNARGLDALAYDKDADFLSWTAMAALLKTALA